MSTIRQERFPGVEAWGAELGDGVAYFSMEFGLTDDLPIYSGGLGVLAADHLRAAADLGLPLTAIGLLYGTAFARQTIDEDGLQISEFPVLDRDRRPIEPLLRDGSQLIVSVPVGGDDVLAAVWLKRVGSVRLLLLDTDVDGNSPELRAITERLYIADRDARLRQEIVLGIGGVRALRADGLRPSLFHLNEGHSLLAALELARQQVEAGATVEEALARVRPRIIFTTHTPVAAGSDYFSRESVRRLLGPYLRGLGYGLEAFMDSGRATPGNRREELCTTYVALRSSGVAVGVSKLHGEVSRRLWKDAGVKIGHVTNGVHMPTWVAEPVQDLLRDHVARDWWRLDPDDPRWAGVAGIPDAQLWDTHRRLRRRLLDSVISTRGDQRLFSPETLTIGFSRRFAGYKRARLLLTDPDRLVKILGNPGREVQVVFAGKAHPSDTAAIELLQEVVRFTREEPRMAFIEDYNLETARLLVQGADVWLNNPRRLLEASGTSGMKAGANGVLNLSTADGWWDEGRRSDAGWTIKSRATLDDPGVDDAVEAAALYRLLEERVVPLFYERDPNGLPSGWIAMMRESIRHTVADFSARRMVLDYYRECYLPAFRRAGLSQTTPSGGRVMTAEQG